MSLTSRPFADLTNVTLADEDTNSKLTDNVKRSIKGNVALHVTQPSGQLWKLMQLVPNFQLSISAIWWSNLEAAPSG